MFGAHTLNVIVNIISYVNTHKKRQFKQKVLDSLDELREDNPKEYWKLINSLKEEEKEGPKSTIELDKWYTSFRSLNKIPEKYKTRIEEINKIVKTWKIAPHFVNLTTR